MHTTMAAPNLSTLKFLILLIILLAFESRAASNGKVTVVIVNVVDVPAKTITVHCKSKDDDLGFHTVPYLGSYQFSFTPNIFLRTLFFCSFTWPGNPHRHYLEIYNAKHDNCRECIWKINMNGGCLNDYKCGPWRSIDLMDAHPSTF
jgi:hypothetical protein